MTFRFQESAEVVLHGGGGHAGILPAGSRGTVFCQYTTVPPAYEVNFRDSQGGEFGVVVYEDENEPLDRRTPKPQRYAPNW